MTLIQECPDPQFSGWTWVKVERPDAYLMTCILRLMAHPGRAKVHHVLSWGPN